MGEDLRLTLGQVDFDKVELESYLSLLGGYCLKVHNAPIKNPINKGHFIHFGTPYNFERIQTRAFAEFERVSTRSFRPDDDSKRFPSTDQVPPSSSIQFYLLLVKTSVLIHNGLTEIIIYSHTSRGFFRFFRISLKNTN